MFLRGPEFRIEYLFPGKSIKYKKNYNNNKKKKLNCQLAERGTANKFSPEYTKLFKEQNKLQ